MFRALADPTRRSLLDELFREDGQTLSALEARFEITRFGVMKHLKQLEEAGLVVTRRRGREKLHFLNPVPIRLVHDRWVSKYAEPWAATLSGLKQRLERPMEKVFEIYIRTTPERLWEAIVDPDIRSKYNFGAAMVVPELKPGAHFEMTAPKAERILGEGEILEVDPPRRLVHTMAAYFSDEAKAEGHLQGHLGDRARRRLVPLAADPRPVARGRQRPALRRLAHGPVRLEDVARVGRAPHHAGVAHVGMSPARPARPSVGSGAGFGWRTRAGTELQCVLVCALGLGARGCDGRERGPAGAARARVPLRPLGGPRHRRLPDRTARRAHPRGPVARQWRGRRR